MISLADSPRDDAAPSAALGRRFVFACPNFTPRTCGVADFSTRLAVEFIRRGHQVTIHSREPAQPNPVAPDVPVVGHPDAGPWSIAHDIYRDLVAAPPTDLIIQYTPQMWNASRFGHPAMPWLAFKAHAVGIRVSMIGHELYYSRLRPDLVVASATQRVELAALLRICHRAFVTTETRQRGLAPLCRLLHLPVPSVVRVGPSALPRARGPVRTSARIGVFSTAQGGKRFDVILDAFARIAGERPDATLVLIGHLGPPDSQAVKTLLATVERHPAAARIRITGRLELEAVAREIQDLDLYFHPMDTGANTRSSTLPTALGSGIPVVAICGRETDSSLFVDRENVAFAADLSGPALAETALAILRDPALAARVSAGARALYERSLAWPRIADHVLAELERT